VRIAPVADDQWELVAWLWQAFRNDMAQVVKQSFPYPDGRYRHAHLDEYPGPSREGWLAWAPHPQSGEDAPVGFSLVADVGTPDQALRDFFVVPAARDDGVGARLAAHALAQHPPPWTVAFQHDNESAGRFWRRVFTTAFGADGWTEEQRPVPGRPDVPPDHWITTT
jgi:predicted acetyltransferase